MCPNSRAIRDSLAHLLDPYLEPQHRRQLTTQGLNLCAATRIWGTEHKHKGVTLWTSNRSSYSQRNIHNALILLHQTLRARKSLREAQSLEGPRASR